MSDDDNFEAGDAGSSHTYPIQAGDIKKGGYALLKGFPCRVVEYSTSKAGKHGHAKATIVGIDIFTGKKYEDSSPTSHNMECPFVKKNEYTLANIQDDGFVQLMKDDGELKEDLKLPSDDPEMVQKLKGDFGADKELLVTVICSMG
jgi:translation initiation factor 5A